MSEHEKPDGPARDGETRRYNLEDELVASQRPGHDIHKDAGIYPADVMERIRTEGLRAAARQDVARLARPAHEVAPGGVSQAALAAERARKVAAGYTTPDSRQGGGSVRYSAQADAYETSLHQHKTQAQRDKYLDRGPKILRPWRVFSLRFIKQGIPPE